MTPTPILTSPGGTTITEVGVGVTLANSGPPANITAVQPIVRGEPQQTYCFGSMLVLLPAGGNYSAQFITGLIPANQPGTLNCGGGSLDVSNAAGTQVAEVIIPAFTVPWNNPNIPIVFNNGFNVHVGTDLTQSGDFKEIITTAGGPFWAWLQVDLTYL